MQRENSIHFQIVGPYICKKKKNYTIYMNHNISSITSHSDIYYYIEKYIISVLNYVISILNNLFYYVHYFNNIGHIALKLFF